MEDKRFQALRPIEKSWMYGNLSALRDCLEQAYDKGHAAASPAEPSIVRRLNEENAEFRKDCIRLSAENTELKAQLAKITQDRDEWKEWTKLYKNNCEKAERERDQAREALRWIPVDEHLPDDNLKVLLVLAANRDNVHYPDRLVEYGFIADGAWFDGGDTRNLEAFNETTWTVTHWMPLPTAPAAVPPSEDAPATPQTDLWKALNDLTKPHHSLCSAFRTTVRGGLGCSCAEHEKAAEPAAQPAGKEASPKVGEKGTQ